MACHIPEMDRGIPSRPHISQHGNERLIILSSCYCLLIYSSEAENQLITSVAPGGYSSMGVSRQAPWDHALGT